MLPARKDGDGFLPNQAVRFEKFIGIRFIFRHGPKLRLKPVGLDSHEAEHGLKAVELQVMASAVAKEMRVIGVVLIADRSGDIAKVALEGDANAGFAGKSEDVGQRLARVNGIDAKVGVERLDAGEQFGAIIGLGMSAAVIEKNRLVD